MTQPTNDTNKVDPITMQDRPAPSLRSALQRAHICVAMIAIGLAGLALTASGLLALHAYAANNLNLLARSLAYTAEAAVVFSDSSAANEAMMQIVATEPLANAKILDRTGKVLAEYRRPIGTTVDALETVLAPIILPRTVRLPIMHERSYAGSLEVSASSAELVTFLLNGVAVLVVCLVLSAVIALYFSRRMVERLTVPLREFASVAHAARESRSMNDRVGPSGFAELDALGKDFNALLDEVELRHSSLQDENANLAHKATHDKLTGLPNRDLFEARLTLALSAAHLSGEQLAVLHLDCNHFKQINDTYGHANGERVLVEISKRVRRLLRETDVLANLGGDQFAVLIRPFHDVLDAQAMADDILASMRAPMLLADATHLSVSLTIGIALFPVDAMTPDDLLRAAGRAENRRLAVVTTN